MVWAANGKDVLQKLDEQFFDLLLMDIMMPEMDGLECARAIREGEFRANASDIPIIACTAHAMTGDKETFMEAGMNGYVSKPLLPDTLFSEMSAVLGMQRLETNAKASQAATDASVAAGATSLSAVVLDLDDVRKRVEGDMELMQTIFQDFLQRLGPRLREMEESLERGDCDQMTRLSHALKGSCGTLGLRQAQQQAALLERTMREGSLEAGKSVYQELLQALDKAQHMIREFLQ